MAGGAAKLPKWQTSKYRAKLSPSKYHAKRKYLTGEKFTRIFPISFF
jgi:hypothetical protein